MRLVYGILIAVVIATAAPRAQQRDPTQFDPMNWFKQSCPQCGVQGYVDFPASGTTLVRDGILFAGWGFECVSGNPVDRIDVSYEVADGGGGWQPLKQAGWALHVGAVARPDVVNAYANVCPDAPTNSGWWLQMTNPPPAGARRIMLKLFSGNVWHADLVRTYNFVDPR